MPELPEVETVVRGLREPLIGRTVHGMWQDSARTIHFADPDAFAARIQGQTFRSVERRAKYILCQLEGDILVIHLGMTGRLYVVPDTAQTDADRWLHFSLQLDNSTQLRFSDARKFGFVSLTPSFDTIAPKLGPEPLEDAFTPEILRERLAGHSKSIKALLLDQSFVAGVGNIYADEALYRARISPLRPANQLTDAEITALHSAIRDVLNLGIIQEGASVSWYRKADGEPGEAQHYLYAYGRDGEPCERCGETIVKIRVAQRGTHYCPSCQS